MQTVLQNDDYKIYDVYDGDGNRCYLCIPNVDSLEYQICCSLNEDTISLGEMLLKASNIYTTLLKRKKNAIYAHMIVDAGELTEAAHDNDNPLYNGLLKKVLATVKNVYDMIIKEKVAGISKNIGIINQGNDDSKFIDWIEINRSLPIERINIGNTKLRMEYFEPDLPLIDTNDNNTLKDINNSLNQEKNLTRTKKPSNNNYGYGNIVMVIITIAVILAFSIGAAYILINQ